MSAASGVAPILTLTGTNKAKVQQLIDIIPNVDTNSTSGAQAGGGYLDEMSPAAAVQLRVELTALMTSIVNV